MNIMQTVLNEPVPVAVADDHVAIREGLAALLQGTGRYKVVVQGEHGGQLVQALEGGAEVAAAIVDLGMPVMDGYATLEWLRTHRPQVRTVAYTKLVDAAVTVRCYRSGAHGLVPKHAPWEELIAALDTVLSGAIQHSAYSQQVLLDNPDGLTPEERAQARMRGQLTPAQLRVLECMGRADDPTYERIAGELSLSPRTVQRHVADLCLAFGVHSKTAVLRAATRLGLLRL